jgi:hypothetical protein
MRPGEEELDSASICIIEVTYGMRVSNRIPRGEGRLAVVCGRPRRSLLGHNPLPCQLEQNPGQDWRMLTSCPRPSCYQLHHCSR